MKTQKINQSVQPVNKITAPRIKINFKEYLSEIYDKPQKIHEAYRYFHKFSLRNSALASSQLLELEPINTFSGWLKLGRKVKKGSKAIALFLPSIYKVENEKGEKEAFTKFILKNHWFGYSQTEGEGVGNEAEINNLISLPNFNKDQALKELNIVQTPFHSINGNRQGYAIPNENIIAINPMAFAPYKTTIHEIAHCLLHKDSGEIIDDINLESSVQEFEAETAAYLVCCSLGKFDHLDYSRGYIRGWINQKDIKETNFERAFDAANQILKAGLVKEEKHLEIAGLS